MHISIKIILYMFQELQFFQLVDRGSRNFERLSYEKDFVSKALTSS
jgi:hypothetical protein